MSSSIFSHLHLAGYRGRLRMPGGGGDACVNELLKSVVEAARAGKGAG
jgi:hypothetical protein